MPEQNSPKGEKETVEVDGEEVSREALIQTYKQKKNWEAANTQKNQELAETRKQLAESQRQVNELIDRAIERVDSDTSKETSTSVSDLVDNLPADVESPEYKKALVGLIEKQGEAKARAIQEEVNKRLEESEKRTRDYSDSRDRAHEIGKANEELLDEVLAREFPDATKAQRQEALENLGSLHGQRYGKFHAGIKAFEYNESAAKAAIRMTDSLHKQQVNKAVSKARTEALKGRMAAGEATLDTGGEGVEKPGPNASAEDKIKYLRSRLDEGGEEAARRALQTFDPKDRADLLKAAYE